MPTEHITYSYKFDELSEEAQIQAVEAIRERLGGDWWDQDDIDDVSDVIAWSFAAAIGAPKVDEYGVADFPGIPGVEFQGWDLDRGDYVLIKGTLTPENALKLPWTEHVEFVDLDPSRYYTSVDAQVDEDRLDPDMERDLTVVREEARRIAEEIEGAVREAMHVALNAGRAEMDYKTGEEYAKEWIEANEPDFDEDGNLS